MADKTYTVASEEGATWINATTGEPREVGEQVELELDDGTETALIAAGWLDEPGPAAKKKKEG